MNAPTAADVNAYGRRPAAIDGVETQKCRENNRLRGRLWR
jgi:hypothetical protein